MDLQDHPMLVIDTDVGSDDALALLLALSNSSWNILAITSVHGNVSVEQATENALRILQFCGKPEIPLHKGCHTPILDQRVGDSYHGKDGLSGHANSLPLPSAKVQKEPAASALVRLAQNHQHQITLVALGPLTNLALAQRLDTSFSSNLKQVYIMGGNIEGKGNITPNMEFNFYCDPEAAKITLQEFKCPLTIIPWEVCINHLQPWEWYDQWISRGTPKAEFIGKVTKSAVTKSRYTVMQPGYHCCDLLAMTVIMHPEVVTRQVRHHMDVEVHGHLTRGQAIVDWRKHSTAVPNVNICLEIDLERVKEIWEKMVE